MPDGSYKAVGDDTPQVPDLTPRELAATQNIIRYIQQKYANKKMKEIFPKLKKETEAIFETIGLAVTVKPNTEAETPAQRQYIRQCAKFGYPCIEIEVSHRINWREGDHSKELWEWEKRKENKRAITSKKIDRWL
jgi:hypothetical protein